MSARLNGRVASTLACFVVAFLGACAEPDDLCAAPFAEWQASDRDGPLLRCDVVPELCGLPFESTIRDADLDEAIDVAFVGDGYVEGRMRAYRERVARLVDEITTDRESIVGRDPALFNFHRVDLVAPSADVSARPLRSCVERKEGSAFVASDLELVARAVADVPSLDLVVVIVDGSSEARPNAPELPSSGIGAIRIRHEDSHRVLTHEMGHALVGLADEYIDFFERHPEADRYALRTSGRLRERNLSLSPDETWDGLVDGAIQGGGRYAYGVYRPTNRCRMIDAYVDVPFCAVCSAEVDRVLRSRRGAGDGAPTCELFAGAVDEEGSRPLHAFARDGNGVRSIAVSADGAPLFEYDPSLFEPDHRAPSNAEIETSARGRVFRIVCEDAAGETSEAVLETAP